MNDLSSVIGHEKVLENLSLLIQKEKTPHALLLHGLKGIGKRLTANHLGYSLICGLKENSNELSFNQNSPLFPQIEAGSCSDFLVIEPEEGKKSIGIEQVRNMLERLSLSSEGKRVIIVDAADQMTPEAANAILKNLEEPGENIHFILVVHNISRLLPTIISRCRQFRFAPLNEIQTKQVIEKAGGNISLSQLAYGSPGAALDLSSSSLDLLEDIQFFMAEHSQPIAAKILKTTQSKRLAPLGFQLLLMEIAKQAKQNAKLCSVYTQINERYEQMQVYNITPQLALEAALQDVVSLYSSK